MSSASWLVGYTTIAQQEFDGGTGTGNVTLISGTYALRHATAARSLIDTLAAAWTLEWGSTVTIVVLRNRLIRITIGGGGAAIAWESATILRDLLGFTGDRGSATTHTADYPSPLLFSAGFMATPTTPQDTEGYTVPQQAIYTSDDLSQVYAVHYGDGTFQELGWPHIVPERMRGADSANGGGTFHQFFEQCAKYRRRFTYYQEIDEDDASSTAVTWTTGRGPYVLREFDGNWYRRTVANAEVSCSLELPLQLVDEVT